MQNSLLYYWLPSRGLSYEQTQKARLVHVMLLSTIAGSLVFGCMSSEHLRQREQFAKVWFPG